MIAIKYTEFAILATLVNLLFQFVSLLIYTDFASLYIAMAVGTLAGLVTKYILDKKFMYLSEAEPSERYPVFLSMPIEDDLGYLDTDGVGIALRHMDQSVQ